MKNSKHTNLQKELIVKKEVWFENASEEQKRIAENNLQSISNLNLTESAKYKGDKAPNFTLRNAFGKSIELKEILQKGPVVLTWYRGGWCPYCNLTLQYLQSSLPDFNRYGANLLALTPELPDKSLSTTEKHQLKFEVLSDVGNKIAKQYGLVYKLTDELALAYEKGFGLNDFNGDNSNELPLTATYVIDTNGAIIYAYLDSDYRNRADNSVILEVLSNM